MEIVRTDKSWHDCMTVDDLATLRSQSAGKLANRHLADDFDDSDADEADSKSRKRKKKQPGRPTSSQATVGLSKRFRGIDTASVMVQTHDLKDKVVVVEPADAALKARLEAIVARHGGTVEQNVREGVTFCYVETGLKMKAKAVVRSGKYDVARSAWLLDSEVKFRPLRPSDMVFATEATLASFKADFDAFGDGYFDEETSDVSLKYSLAKVTELDEEVEVTQEVMAEFESLNYPNAFKLGLFRQLTFYVEPHVEDGVDHLAATKFSARFYGGKIVDKIENELGVTHVILDEADSEGLEGLRRIRRGLEKKFHIVTKDWIEECLKTVTIVKERDYEPK